MEFVRSHHVTCSRAVLFSGTAILLAACQSAAPHPTPERAIADAVGVADAIALHCEGGPLDAGAEEGSSLTLVDALGRALHQSSELQASLARVRIALADAQQARMLPNPILDLVVRFPEGGGKPSLEAGVSAEVLPLLLRSRRSSAADDRLRSAVADSVATSISVAAEVQERYAEVQALDELARLLRDRSTVLRRLISLAHSRFEFGEASKLEVTTLEAQGVELEIEIAAREAERRENRIALARAIGRPSSTATWTLDGWAALPDLAGDEAAWLAVALEQRPEIRAGRWELAALGDEAAAAGTTLLEGSRVGLEAERDPDWSFGPALAVPLPLFDFGGPRRDRAEAAIIEARHRFVRAQRGVVEEVRRAHAAYSAAKASLERVRRELIPLQQQRREQVEGIYLAGQADVTVVLLAEQDLQSSQAKLVALERAATISLVRLERAVGGSGSAKRVGLPPDAEQEPETYVKEGSK